MSEPAPYTPTTLARIRAGASAGDLGWGQEQYNRICDKHGIEKRLTVKPSHKSLQRMAIGQVSYNPSIGIVHRGYRDVLLSNDRDRVVFEHLFSLASSGDESFVSRTMLMGLCGDCSDQTMRKVMYRLRDRIVPVKCLIQSSFGKNGGYRLVVEP